MGTQLTLPQRAAEPRKVLADICCGQIVAGIKMPLGMETELGPGDFELNGDPVALPKKGTEPPPKKIFSAHVYCG